MVDPIDLHVGRRLRGRRLTIRISQEELGKTVGVTFQQIQYENARTASAAAVWPRWQARSGLSPAISSRARLASAARGMAALKKPLGSPSHSPIRH